MSSFDDRKQAYENKFAHDQETEFKVRSKAYISLARWAVGKMHLEGSAIDAYATQIIDYSISNSGEENLIGKIATDIRAKGVEIEEKEIKKHLEGFLLEARENF